MRTKSELTRGQKISYQKEIIFKGTQTVTAKIVAITSTRILLDNGDELHIINA
jgi:hypothetical protein